jgi:uncharacterized protein (DUF2267 family)
MWAPIPRIGQCCLDFEPSELMVVNVKLSRGAYCLIGNGCHGSPRRTAWRQTRRKTPPQWQPRDRRHQPDRTRGLARTTAKGNPMSANGLEVFDKTVQTTNAWLKEIMEETGLDRRRAYRVLAAVLHALRDRLTVDEVAQLGSQLPILVRGLYYDQWHPAGKPERLRHQEEFLAAVADGLDDIDPVDADEATRAVLAVLEHHIAPGEIDDVKAMLPARLRELWP